MAMRPGKRRGLEPGSEEAVLERLKAQVRAMVEHPFLKVKRQFGYARVRYRGLVKNTERLAMLLGLGNLLTAQRHLAGVVREPTAPDRPFRQYQARIGHRRVRSAGPSPAQQAS